SSYEVNANDAYTYVGLTPNMNQQMSAAVNNPGDIHWTTVKNILKYLRNTKDMFLVYEEAEYIAVFDASKEAVWVRKFISGLGVVSTIEEPISMYCDNTGAIVIANESGITKGARHFRAKVHYLREVDLTKKFLSLRFSIKDMGGGGAYVILGIRIKHESNVSTPLDTCEKLMPNRGLVVSQLDYSRVIGYLMYAMTCTRPDIAFVVGKLSSNTKDNSSTIGWVSLLGGGAISWASKKQTCITGSTMEYEFVALVAACKEAECAATLAKAYSQMYNGKSRHLDDHLMKGLARDLVVKSAKGMGLRAEAHVLQIIPRMCLEPAVRRMKLITSQWLSSSNASSLEAGIFSEEIIDAVCLIGCVYKVISRILALRLSKVISLIIGPNQTAFIAGIQLASNEANLSLLQYANDSLFFGDWLRLNAKNLISILKCFELASGLKINMGKIQLIRIGVATDDVVSVASSFGCSHDSIPFIYLGLPVGKRINLCDRWDIVINQFRERLSSWKANSLSIGKWRWCYLTEIDAHWGVVISNFYGNDGGFGLNPTLSRFSGVWCDILKATKNIREIVPFFKNLFVLSNVGSNVFFGIKPGVVLALVLGIFFLDFTLSKWIKTARAIDDLSSLVSLIGNLTPLNDGSCLELLLIKISAFQRQSINTLHIVSPLIGFLIQNAIAISHNLVQHLRTKHIDVRYNFIKEHVENGMVVIITPERLKRLAESEEAAATKGEMKYEMKIPEAMLNDKIKMPPGLDLNNLSLNDLRSFSIFTSEMEHSNPTLAKIPILDTGKFEQWKFRIQQYLQNEHYALWEVIEFSDSYEVPQDDVATEGTKILEQTFNRLQAIVSHLEFINIKIEQDDLNQKFLTSLAPEWLMYTIVWRNRSDLDTMNLDDVYNHLKVYESEVQKKSESNSQNMAFISLAKNSSGNREVNTASIPTTSTQVSLAGPNVATANISLDTACAYIASQSNGECRAPRSQERDRRKNYRQGSKEEEQAPKALMAIDGVGWDWSFMENEEENHALVADEEAPTEFALMAKSSSNNEVFDNSLCSKTCKKNTDSLNSKITELSEKLSDTKTTLYHYKLEMLKKEKEGLDTKLTGFQSASKDLDNLIGSQRSNKNKEGLGYSAVPPPAQVYSPPKKDMSWTGLLEFADNTITDYTRPSSSIESNPNDLQNNISSVFENGESTSDILSKPKIKFVKATDSPTVIKTNKDETVRKPSDKYAEMYRKTSKSSNVRGIKETGII
nr:zinc finger, CCHC-type [Tanacetum cinerariifolium]